jgi:hypothetical protein
MSEYIGKPVPQEAEDVHQFFGDERIFALGFIRFLVNDENIVTFEYDVSPPALEKAEK